ncbi:PH domain-containing protein [Nocardia sp. NPDC003963]
MDEREATIESTAGLGRLPVRALGAMCLHGAMMTSPILIGLLVFGVLQGSALTSLLPGLAVGIWCTWRWVFVRWAVRDETLVCHTGGLRRRRASLDLASVTTLRTEISVVQRIFGLCELYVCGRGSGGAPSAVRLVGLDRDAAARLSELVQNAAPTSAENAHPDRSFRYRSRWSMVDLVNVSGVALLIGAYFTATELFGDALVGRLLADTVRSAGSAYHWSVLIGVVLVTVVWLSVASAFTQYYRLHAQFTNGEFSSTRGMYALKEVRFAEAQVLGMEWRTPFWLSGRFTRVDAVVSGIGGTRHGQASMVLPLVPTRRALAVAEWLAPRASALGRFPRPSGLRFAVAALADLWTAAVLLALSGAASWVFGVSMPVWGWVAVSGAYLSVAFVKRFMFRQQRVPGGVAIRGRTISRQIDVLDLSRVELIEIRANALQDRLGFAALRLYFGGGRFWYDGPLVARTALDVLVADWAAARVSDRAVDIAAAPVSR